MKLRTILLILIVGLILVGAPFVAREGVYLDKGKDAPELSLSNGVSDFSLADMKGRYVLLDFWSAADASSRLKENKYNALDWGGGKNEPVWVSVNFDDDETLFQEIVNRDRLNDSTQYHVEGREAAKIRSSYNLKDGYKSYLIGPDGKIVAINPAPEYIGQRFKI